MADETRKTDRDEDVLSEDLLDAVSGGIDDAHGCLGCPHVATGPFLKGTHTLVDGSIVRNGTKIGSLEG